jgi:hemolysin type calcium-binding protein
MTLISGTACSDTLSGTANRDSIFGLAGHDRLSGRAGSDRIVGGVGRDTLFGGGGNDLLLGGAWKDMLHGGSGSDTLVGGLGRDIMYGGSGADEFRFDDKDAGARPLFDVIGDFSSEDVIDLVAVDVTFCTYGGEPGLGGFGTWTDGVNSYVTWHTRAGFHEIKVTGYSDWYGLLQQIRWYEDDYLANVDTNGRISAGQTRSGTIQNDGETDWFGITLTEGRLYTFDLANGTLVSPYLKLYDAGGDSVDGAWGWPPFQFYVNNAATYFVEVGGIGGTYQLAVTAQTIDDDYAGNTGTAGRIASGQARNSEIEVAGDLDWFRVNLTGGKIYTLDVRGAADGGGTLDYAYVNIYDADGVHVAGEYEGVDFFADGSAPYFVEVGYGSVIGGTYELAVTPKADDYASDPCTTGRIAAGETRNGTIDAPRDADWFRISLTEDKIYTFDVQGLADGGGTLDNPFVRLYAAHDLGSSIGGYYGELKFLATSSGTYFVEAAGESTGTYKLAATARTDDDDYAGDASTTGRIAAGETRSGEIQYVYDGDWLRISLTAGMIYTFDVQGLADGGGTLDIPYVNLYNAESEWLAGEYEEVQFVANSSGTYFVEVAAADHTGTYELNVAIDDPLSV